MHSNLPQALVLVVLLVAIGVQAQGDVALPADSKIGYVVIGILLALAAIGMFIRIKDLYLVEYIMA